MRLLEAAERSFARHETFHPRYGWFRKAYTFVDSDPRAFLRKDATIQFGVGKNMVRAIRFWGIAAKLIDRAQESGGDRSGRLGPTPLGHRLFGSVGWDPYMEDPGTIWLLHWLLLAPKSQLPVWWLAFNEFSALEFADVELEAVISAKLANIGWRKPHASSVKKDISVFLRTYAPVDRSKRTSIDDMLDCPLRELNLITRAAATGRYRFSLGSKPALPPAVLTFSILDYVSRAKTGGSTITLSRLAHEPGAPGLAFRLTERELYETIESAAINVKEVTLTRVAGVPQITWTGDPTMIALDVLNTYYGERGTAPPSSRPKILSQHRDRPSHKLQDRQ